MMSKMQTFLSKLAMRCVVWAPSVRVFWWRDRNLGDSLNTWLFRSYGIRSIFSEVPESDVIGIGSILEHVPSNYSGSILGSGFIRQESAIDLSAANLIAIRGKMTAERCNAPVTTVLGDPGLLVERLLPSRPAATHSLGIIPHYVDKGNSVLTRLIEKDRGGDIKIIDVTASCPDVVREIATCRNILSSSLHGIIAADAFGIPSGWLILSDKVIGDGFKFRDYYSAFDERREPITIRGDEDLETLLSMTNSPPEGIADRKAQLDDVFVRLREHKRY